MILGYMNEIPILTLLQMIHKGNRRCAAIGNHSITPYMYLALEVSDGGILLGKEVVNLLLQGTNLLLRLLQTPCEARGGRLHNQLHIIST